MTRRSRANARATVAVLADCGYLSLAEIEEVEAQGIETYVPDPLLARELPAAMR